MLISKWKTFISVLQADKEGREMSEEQLSDQDNTCIENIAIGLPRRQYIRT